MQLETEDLVPPAEIEEILTAAGIEWVRDDDPDDPDTFDQAAVVARKAAYDAEVARDEDERDAQDDVEGLGAGGTIRTPKEAVKLGRQWIVTALFVGVGYCLRTMRSLFNVDALYLDAETAWEEAKHKHPATDDPAGLAKIPWGVLIWWTNGRHGHVALYIGHGWCITTDYKRPGYLCIARVAALASWCSGRFAGWTEDINNVTVWKPKEKPEPFGIDDRIRELQALLERARKHNARQRRIDGLQKWLDRMVARRDRMKKEHQK